MALCCSYILNELETESYVFRSFDADCYEEVEYAVERYCCEVQEKGHRRAFDELRSYLLVFFTEGISIERCFAVAYFIDENIDIDITDQLLGGNGIIAYESLNESYRDRVRIIPKMESTLLTRSERRYNEYSDNAQELFRTRRECACSEVDGEFIHYSIWDQEKIKKYPLTIYHIDEKNPISKHFYQRSQIVFGIVPFTNLELEKILKIKYFRSTFSVEKMDETAEKMLAERYRKICEGCDNKDIDFLIFPEMLMTKRIIDSIDKNHKSDSPQFIVNGSIWENRTNKCIVSDGEGNEIFSYLKKQPFTLKKDKKEYVEYLDPSRNRHFAILEIEDIGRIGICICKDLINEEIKMFHKYIWTNILIVPAYTQSMDLQSAAEELSKDYHCIVVVVNACSAIENGTKKKQIGFLTLPAKEKSTRSELTIKYFQDDCKKGCKYKCSGKIFFVNFLNIESANEEYHFNVTQGVL